MHRLENNQLIPAGIEQVWAFFSDPANLFRLTPAYLNLKAIDQEDGPARAGQLIRYRVRPLLNIPVTWVTRITHVHARNSFVDEQVKGPYRYWRHEHQFREVEGGVEMTDRVDYQLPMAFIGDLVNELVVKGSLRTIFEYRFNRINELFGRVEGQECRIRMS